MVNDKQTDQYFQFVKDILLEEIISAPLIHSAHLTSIKKLGYHSGFGQSDAAMYMITAYTHGLYYLKSVRCHWRPVPCYARAGHIFSCMELY